MPELAEVEVARINVERWWVGQAADAIELLDPKLSPDPDALFAALSMPMTAAIRRGKQLIMERADGGHLVFHFRMSGKIVRADQPEGRSARLAWHLPETGWLLFKDYRRFAQITPLAPGELARYEPVQKIGPEPHDVSGEMMQGLLQSRKRLKDRLLDQTVIAGVGNIAICEVFWRLQLPPDVRCDTITDAQADALAAELPAYFDWLVEAQSADEIAYLNEGSAAENPFSVYRRAGEPCPRCATPIDRVKVGGRSSYFCPTCQG